MTKIFRPNAVPKSRQPRHWKNQATSCCLGRTWHLVVIALVVAIGASGCMYHAGRSSVSVDQRDLNKISALIQQGNKYAKGLSPLSVDVCRQAMPYWKQAYTKLRAIPGDDGLRYSVGLSIGSCLEAEHRYEEAVKVFNDSSGRDRFNARISLKLAMLYADGQGVEPDPIRALGYYMLGDYGGYDSSQSIELSKVRRRMAEILIARGDATYATDRIRELLEQGEARNWLRSIELRRDHVSDRISTQLNALTSAIDAGPEDDAALKRMRLNIGRDFLGFDSSHLPVALYFLKSSGLVDSKNALAQLESKLPYILTLPNGKTWSALDGDR
ncbi:hypothetical protein [Burkholderia ambifaria]|uniref:hypothetical protein n=1 Tax=Burkholderia ambifaria TaxID=152480 RepID=UPI00158DCE42|nr:hypothetical protein [Burkholderia ambifaria]